MKKLIAMLLLVCMLISMLPMGTYAAFPDSMQVSDFAALYNGDNNPSTNQPYNTWTDVTSSSDIKRYLRTSFYIFNNLRHGSDVLDGLRFQVGTSGAIDQAKGISYVVLDTPVTTIDQVKALTFSGSIGTSYHTYEGADTSITNKSYFDYNLSSVQISKGQTLAIRLSGGNNDKLAYPAASTYVKPQLVYQYNQEAYEAAVLAEIKAADTAELKGVLTQYNQGLSIADSDLALADEYTIAGIKAKIDTVSGLDGVKTAFEQGLEAGIAAALTADIAADTLVTLINRYSAKLSIAYTDFIDGNTKDEISTALNGQNLLTYAEISGAINSAVDAGILAAIDNAGQSDLVTVLNTYHTHNELQLSELDEERYKDALWKEFDGKTIEGFDDVRTMVKTAVDAADLIYKTEDITVADMIVGRYKNNNAETGEEVWSFLSDAETLNRWDYNVQIWVFNNIDNGSYIKNPRFQIGSDSGSGQTKNLYYMVLDQPITTVEEARALSFTDRVDAITSGENMQWKNDATTDNKGYYEYDLSSRITLSKGKTLVLKMSGGNSTIFAGLTTVSYVKPQLVYNWDSEAYEAELVAKVNDAADISELKSVLVEHQSRFGINTEQIEDLYAADTQAGSNTVYLKSMLDVEYTSYAEVYDDYTLATIEYTKTQNTYTSQPLKVSSTPRQTFEGFAFTVGQGTAPHSWSEARRESLLYDGIDGINTKMIKVWFNLSQISPYDQDGNVSLDNFKAKYNMADAENNVFAYIKEHGVDELMLGISGAAPKAMQQIDAETGEPTGGLADDYADDYGTLIGQLVKLFADEGIRFTMVSVTNEGNLGISIAGFGSAYVALDAQLKADGLRSQVKIVGPEIASCNSGLESFWANLSAEAKAALDMVAIHSYDMSLKKSQGDAFLNGGKRIISTESCTTGIYETSLELFSHAATSAARAINDINNGSSLFTYFQMWNGLQNGVSLMGSREGQKKPAYNYIQLLSEAFCDGTVIRNMTTQNYSSLTGWYGTNAMNYTYGTKPTLNAAAGVNPDGKWAIAVVNGTDTLRSTLEEKGYRTVADKYIETTITVEELADADTRVFDLYRTNMSDSGKVVKTGTVTFTNGVSQPIKLDPREMIVLREQTDKKVTVAHTAQDAERVYLRIAAKRGLSKDLQGVLATFDAQGALVDASLVAISKDNVYTPVFADMTGAASYKMFVFDSLNNLKPEMYDN